MSKEVIVNEKRYLRKNWDKELLRSPKIGEPDFRHTDPWRVLRIQGEFVEGFDALAGVGPCIAFWFCSSYT